MAQINLSRQSKLVPADQLEQWKFEVFGVGSVGSHVVELLAKVGAQHIKVYDMDTVDEENIGPQAFGSSHIGKTKVEAIAEICKESAGLEIETSHGELTEESEISPEPQTIYICVFDSFAARKMIWNKLKDYPIIFVDGRIGRFDMRHYLIDTSDPKQVEYYIQSIPESGEGSDLICGEKASAMINYEIAGKMVSNIINFVAGRGYEKAFIGNASDAQMNIHVRIEREPPQTDDGSEQEGDENDMVDMAPDSDI